MDMRRFLNALLATLLLGATTATVAQDFLSVSSLPAAPVAAAPVATAPVTAAPLPPASSATAALAFSSVSSLNSAGSGAGSGPFVPAVPSASIADRVVVEKAARRLLLLRRGQVIAEYPVKLGLSPKGHKQYEGDFRTPEGVYYLSRRNSNSEFFLSVGVSYPNDVDRARAKAEGLRPGGNIMIHGQPNVPKKPRDYYAKNDWTDGCIAVSNGAMADIWQRTRVGIPIEIRP